MKNNEHNFDNDPKFPFDENGKNPFGLPSDYFSSFEDKLKKRLENENELSEFPLLSSIAKINSFSTPDNYFSISQNKLEHAAELASYISLLSIKQQVFSELDKNYVDAFKESLQSKIELVEELKAYNVLYTLNKEKSFIVPDNYFEDLSLRIKDRIHVAKQANVSLLDNVLDFLFGKKFALSFGLVIVIGLSIFFYQISKSNVELNDCQTLACLEKHDILNDKSISNFDEEQLMDLVDVNSLGKQLQKETLATDSLQQEEFILDNVDTDQLLEEL